MNKEDLPIQMTDNPDDDVSVTWVERVGIFAFVTVLLTIGFALGRCTA